MVNQQQLQAMMGCNALNVRRTMRAVTQLYDHALAQTGLRSTQLPILVTVCLNPGARVKDLADKMGMDPSSMVRNLRPLEREGLIELRQHESDGRARTAFITEAGQEKVTTAHGAWSGVQTRLRQALGGEWYTVREALSELGEAAREVARPEQRPA